MATVDPHVTAAPAATPPVSRGSQMSMGMLAMIFFLGEKLLTTPNPAPDEDARLLERLGLTVG